MGKALLPLVSIPSMRGNGGDNNRRLLRKPQRKKPEPLRECLSPPDTPEDLEEENELTEVPNRAMNSVNSEFLPQPDPNTPRVPPPTEGSISSPAKKPAYLRTSLELTSQLASIRDETPVGADIQVNITHSKAPSKKAQSQPRTAPAWSVPASQKQVLRTTFHSGPEGLPPPNPRLPRNLVPFEATAEKGPSEIDHLRALRLAAEPRNVPSMRVNQFFTDVASHFNLNSTYQSESITFSRANFKQLTKMVAEKLAAESNRRQGKITNKNLNSLIAHHDLPFRPSSHAVTGSRVPQKQILIQMASMLTEQIQATLEGSNIRALIRPFPKWSYNRPIDELPRAEIVLYEESPLSEEEEDMQLLVRGEGTTPTADGMFMRHADEKHFMDSRRNYTPFEFGGENGLDNTDIAVLDALVTGGAVLSLKAHFIDSMPDISPLTSSIRYLNLSFNSFINIPPEVLLLHNLEVLKLRNNPIREIPDEIRHLKFLRTFEMPFCLISNLPEGLFSLKHLQYLDLSFNKLEVLPTSLKRLRSLQVLFLEGNQLSSLPCSCLALQHLHYIRVRNNFMHRLFWPDLTKDRESPQKLKDLAGLVMKQLGLDVRYGPNLPDAAREFLSSSKECDCCHGPLVGDGLTVVRSASLYGVKNLPFLFKSCSHYCASLFLKNTTHLQDLVYAESETGND